MSSKVISKKEAKERILRLAETVSRHAKLYHEKDNPEISDEAYDSLLKELAELEQKFPKFKSLASPTQRVGGTPIKEFVKVRHEVRQWSFDNVFDFNELKEWEERTTRFLKKEGRSSHFECRIDVLKEDKPAGRAILADFSLVPVS